MPSVIARPVRTALPLLAALLAAAGCSADGGREDSPEATREAARAGQTQEEAPAGAIGDPVAAAEVCDGALSPEAGAALEGLTGASEFEELGGQEAGDAAPADLAAFADGLPASEAYYEDFCVVGAAGAGEPSARVAFGLREAVDVPGTPGPREVRYAAGDYAYATDASAIVVFPCAGAGAGPGDPGHVEANLWTGGDSPATRDAQITLAVSFSRALAGRLGCLDGAGLPEGVPERVAGG
ncbi:hypothetical protein ACL02R_17665 [Streptomyces sp. MS19]|uniref:hypothetical protein n=1 Tax=Streptomyces sp. MS19 TaxID=3385972 RepID=UPI0039A195D0